MCVYIYIYIYIYIIFFVWIIDWMYAYINKFRHIPFCPIKYHNFLMSLINPKQLYQFQSFPINIINKGVLCHIYYYYDNNNNNKCCYNWNSTALLLTHVLVWCISTHREWIITISSVSMRVKMYHFDPQSMPMMLRIIIIIIIMVTVSVFSVCYFMYI